MVDRYFRTNADWLWLRWDGEHFHFSGIGDLNRPGIWSCDYDGHKWNPETVNYLTREDPYEPDDPLYIYETDENWNRL